MTVTRVGIVLAASIGLIQSQTIAPVATRKFDVVSVKPCKVDAPPGGGGNSESGRGGGASGSQSPGRLYLPCRSVSSLTLHAVTTESVLRGEVSASKPRAIITEIEGGPAWINSEQYTIEAKLEGTATQEMMHGPMLRAILEDRFKLKAHRGTKEIPMYALTVAKGGLKLQQPDDTRCTEPYAGGPAQGGGDFLPLGCVKLQQAQAGICTPRDFTQASLPLGPKPPCSAPRQGRSESRAMTDVLGASMAEIAGSLFAGTGRPVMNKTGIPDTERFDFHLEYTRDGAEPSDEAGRAPAFVTALGQLGLKLEPAKGPRDVLVIDHVERPSQN